MLYVSRHLPFADNDTGVAGVTNVFRKCIQSGIEMGKRLIMLEIVSACEEPGSGSGANRVAWP